MAQLPDGQVALVGDDDTYGSARARTAIGSVSSATSCRAREVGRGNSRASAISFFFSTGLDYPGGDRRHGGRHDSPGGRPSLRRELRDQRVRRCLRHGVVRHLRVSRHVGRAVGERRHAGGDAALLRRPFAAAAGGGHPSRDHAARPGERLVLVFRSLGSLSSSDPVGRVPLRLHDLVAPDLGGGDVLPPPAVSGSSTSTGPVPAPSGAATARRQEPPRSTRPTPGEPVRASWWSSRASSGFRRATRRRAASCG